MAQYCYERLKHHSSFFSLPHFLLKRVAEVVEDEELSNTDDPLHDTEQVDMTQNH